MLGYTELVLQRLESYNSLSAIYRHFKMFAYFGTSRGKANSVYITDYTVLFKVSLKN